MAIIQIKGLKKYFGETKAVDGISLNIKKGEVFGFLGPNGAGKTTTIRCMMDFLRPTAGSISILGHDAHQDSVFLKKQIGYLSEGTRLYEGWTGKEHINLLQGIKGKSKIVDELIGRLNFNPRVKVKNLSTGNRQKLSLILALMHQPKLLILDEPTVGLDPLLQNTIYGILKEFREKGCTIFMSSHNLREVELICNRVGIIKEGQMMATETISNLKKKKLYQITIYFGEKYDIKDFQVEEVKIVEANTDMLILQVKEDIQPIIKELAKYKLKDLEISRARLEDIFLEFYEASDSLRS